MAGRSLAIETPGRFWGLTAESDLQAQEWATAINLAISGATMTDSSEVDMLPGHGDWMLKRGKGIGKYADDKVRMRGPSWLGLAA